MYFSYTFFLCEVFVKSFTTFFLLESVKRCGDVLSLVITLLLCPILRSPGWFVNGSWQSYPGDLMWFCMTLLLHFYFFLGGDSVHKTSRSCKTGSWLRQGCLHRAFRRIIRCLRGSVWHPVVVFLAWNLKSLKCLQPDWIGWLHVITILHLKFYAHIVSRQIFEFM